MKKIIYILVVCCLVLIFKLNASEVDSFKFWINLSAASQNASVLMAQSKSGGAVDPTTVEPIITKISESLEGLCQTGYLVSKNFKFRQEDIFDEKTSKIRDFVFRISDKYGYYTSLEMMNQGMSQKIKTYHKNELVVLKVFLTEADMKAFEKYSKSFSIKNPKEE